MSRVSLLTWPWEMGKKYFQMHVDGQPKVRFGNGKRRWTRIGALYHAYALAKPNDWFLSWDRLPKNHLLGDFLFNMEGYIFLARVALMSCMAHVALHVDVDCEAIRACLFAPWDLGKG